MEQPQIRVGVSSCLLGMHVRYDGGHKRDKFILNTLGKHFEWVHVCPEVECGLTTPREAMRLVGDPSQPRLVTSRTGVDHTERMQRWAEEKLDELEEKELAGFIFKAKSPSSGMERIKVYDHNGIPQPVGRGIFASMFMERFPHIPVEDDGRLHDPDLRENFIERVFVMQRWFDMLKEGKTRGNLVDFHTRHKLLIMAHSVEEYREMGRLVASAKDYDEDELFQRYLEHLTRAMKTHATNKKNANVLEHMLGYFKDQLSGDEKQEMLEVIEHFKRGDVPLIVPITLFNHYIRKYDEQYLKGQVYLEPHPVELQLRNHS